MTRFQVVTWHGEGGSVFSVVDSAAPEADQPAVVACYQFRQQAESHAAVANSEVRP